MPETIQAHITKVEQEVGSDWGAIYTDHDRVKKMTTRIAEKIAEAAEFRKSGVLVGIDYTEKTRNVDGRTYRNFYYERAGALGEGKPESGIDVVQPTRQAEDPDRAWRICLQSGGKLAVATLPLMPTEQRDFETQKTIARAWAEFFFFTPRPEADSFGSGRNTPSAYREPEQPPPYADDDIPY